MSLYSNTRAALKELGVEPKKGLGQNFLVDDFVLQKILKAAALSSSDKILEIGPGLGTLTKELAKRAELVHAIEIDKRLSERLSFILPANVNIICADFLKSDLPKDLNKAVANLPYSITAPTLEKLLLGGFSSITVMVQEEVARRMIARPAQRKDYGALSLFVEYFAEAEIAAFVPANCFYPRPKVGSCVVNLRARPKKEKDLDLFKHIRAGFAHRRKTLANCLAVLYPENATLISKILLETGIKKNARAETLTLADWVELVKKLKNNV